MKLIWFSSPYATPELFSKFKSSSPMTIGTFFSHGLTSNIEEFTCKSHLTSAKVQESARALSFCHVSEQRSFQDGWRSVDGFESSAPLVHGSPACRHRRHVDGSDVKHGCHNTRYTYAVHDGKEISVYGSHLFNIDECKGYSRWKPSWYLCGSSVEPVCGSVLYMWCRDRVSDVTFLYIVEHLLHWITTRYI